MLYFSYEFIVFFCGSLLLFYLLPKRPRATFLLAASYFFYGYASVWHLGILLYVTLVSFLAGLKIEKSKRKVFLLVGITSILAPLLLFKYASFFIEASLGTSSLNQPRLFGLDLLLPIGISFYTFQAISYIVDIYRGEMSAERNLIALSLYLAFFLQVLAGPIERAKQLIPQFFSINKLDFAKVRIPVNAATWSIQCSHLIGAKRRISFMGS